MLKTYSQKKDRAPEPIGFRADVKANAMPIIVDKTKDYYISDTGKKFIKSVFNSLWRVAGFGKPDFASNGKPIGRSQLPKHETTLLQRKAKRR